MKVKPIYIITNTFFIGLAIFAFVLLYQSKESNINTILENNLQLNTVQFKAIKAHFKMIATNMNKIIINDKDVIDIFKKAKDANDTERSIIRNKLYNVLEDNYDFLKKSGIRQLHFHLQDNTSFLRMHKPSLYGDDLSEVRYSVKKTNETLEPVFGFEEGRVVNGFRNIFPVFDENKIYLGSAEVSISSKGYTEMFQKDFNSDAHFLIKKSLVNKKLFVDEIVKHYKDSLESQKYYQELSPSDDLEHAHLALVKNDMLLKEISEKMKSEKSFSIYLGKNQILSLISIKNIQEERVVAYLALYSTNKNIENIISIYWILNGATTLILVILLFLAFQWYRSSLEVKNINVNLEQRIKEEIEKNQKQNELLLYQSRFAQMGEMISLIAHQWRQPLNAISLTSGNLQFKLMVDDVDHGFFKKEITLIDGYAQHLSKTIDDFRDFFKEDKKEKITTLQRMIKSTLEIVRVSLENKNINIIVSIDCETEFKTYKNEVMQVILNIIKNAEDALLEKSISNPTIWIEAPADTLEPTLIIRDNAGGVPEEILGKIFDPYFSTKLEKEGTGLGLYMSKIIINEHCKGTLTVQNKEDGAEFVMVFGADTMTGEQDE